MKKVPYPKPDNLQIIQFLRLLPRPAIDVAEFCQPTSHFTRVSKFPTFDAYFNTVCPQLLDAFACFIRGEPGSGKAYALSISLDAGGVIVSLAGNDPLERTPLVVLETMWNHMVKLSTSSIDTSKELHDDFVAYLLGLTLASHRHRFNEGRKEYEEAWQAYTSKTGYVGYIITSYMKNAHPLYTITKEFYDSLGSKNVANVNQDTLREYMDKMLVQCQALEKTTKERCGGGDEWRDAGSEIIQQGLGFSKSQFDPVDYINNIRGPFFHAQQLIDISTSPKCRDYLRLRFRIHNITDPGLYMVHRPSAPVHWNDKTCVTKFATDVMLTRGMIIARRYFREYLTYGPPSIADDIIQNLSEGQEHVTPRPSRPHCGCLLVQHHQQDQERGIRTHWYFALTEPSCLQCIIFLHGYNTTCFTRPKFFSKRGYSIAPPFQTPAFDTSTDEVIMREMNREFYLAAQDIIWGRELKLNPKPKVYSWS